MAGQYLASAAYWTERLRAEGATRDGFDWLLAGDDAGFKSFIKETVDSFSETTRSAPEDSLQAPPRILHIGPGSSRLSLWLRNLLSDPRDVAHVDFAPSAKEVGERWEREEWPDNTNAIEVAAPAGEMKSVKRMHWLTADILQFDDVLRLPARVAETDIADGRYTSNGQQTPLSSALTTTEATEQTANNKFNPPIYFTILIDKGTLDAVSCAADLSAASQSADLVCRIRKYAPSMPTRKLNAPIYSSLVVAMNLAAIAAPGAAWIFLSYSGTRFDMFAMKIPVPQDGKMEEPKTLEELAARLWRLEVRRELVAEEKAKGGETGNSAPVYHWLYLLRRTEVLF